MIFIGIGLLIIGAVLFFTQRHQNQKVFSIKSARAMTASELTATAGAVAEEIGGGSWRDYVKVWGEITTPQPLYSEHKQEPCVHYVAKVLREYEKTETTKAQDGSVKTEQKRTSEVVSQNKQSIPFLLRDRSGTVKVDLTGADIETIAILNEFRAERSGTTLGYRYQESVLPVGRNVLVVGAVSDLTGEVLIGKPVKSANKYLISLKDEEALVATTQRNAKGTFAFMVTCFGIGALLLILGILK